MTVVSDVSRLVGDIVAVTATSNGNAGGTTMVDASLAWADDDYFSDNAYYLLILTGTYAGEVRRVSDFTSATGTITVSVAFSGQILSTVTAELHKYDPVDIQAAINQAIARVYPMLYLPVVDETLVMDNILANAGFESAISASDWTLVGAGAAVTYNTTTYLWRKRSARLAAGGGAAGQLTQAPTVRVKEMTGKTVTFKGWVYCTAASTARLRIDWDGTNFENHAYHSGKDQWEYQEISVSIPTTATQVKAICEVAASGVGFFNACSLAIDKVYRYTLPTSFVGFPSWVGVAHSLDNPSEGYAAHPYVTFESDGTTRYILFTPSDAPDSHYRIQLRGRGHLTEFTALSDTIELTNERLRAFEEMAAAELCYILAAPGHHTEGDPTDFRGAAKEHEQKAFEMLGRPGIRMPSVPALLTGPRLW